MPRAVTPSLRADHHLCTARPPRPAGNCGHNNPDQCDPTADDCAGGYRCEPVTHIQSGKECQTYECVHVGFGAGGSQG